MPQNWVTLICSLSGLLGLFAIACYMKRQDNRMHKVLREIRESQVDMLEQIESLTQTELPAIVSDEDSRDESARKATMTEIPESASRADISHAEADLLSKVQASVRSEDYLPLRDNPR